MNTEQTETELGDDEDIDNLKIELAELERELRSMLAEPGSTTGAAW